MNGFGKDVSEQVIRETTDEMVALGLRDIGYEYRLRYTVEGNTIHLSFDHVGSGLLAKDGDLTHFIIAGDDKVFVEAVAKIENDTVVNPVAVRFAFSNTAMPNLFNKEGLPASSFRTDDW